uniref:Uncharacterized protein n=1 Tax=uncultured prokaryote TaxID=198431 RepID=A0A0H5Q5M9_9ZZZZ|nr:hypothetical protein [uncultured prokaryote]
MASAQWNGGKAKSTAQAKAWMRHNSKDERIAANHSNTDIDKSRTPLNWSYRGLSYKARCAAYDKRLSEIDMGKPGTGKNARTVLQSVCVYSPAALRGDLPRLRDWFQRVGELAEAQFGAANVIDMAVDVDEVHDYADEDTGEQRTAAEHGHLWLVPEKDGKLNGKEFSCRAAIVAFNDRLQYMTEREFGCVWNDGTKKKRRGTVEQLKRNSLRAEVEQLEEVRDTILTDAMEQATEITTEAQRDARATRREADDYAYKARRTANRHAVDITNKAEADAQEIREAAELDAQAMREQAEQDAQAMREQVAAMRRERDEAQADRDAAHQDAQEWANKAYRLKQGCDKLQTARKATRAALQGDLETWAGLTPRPSANALLGVLGAAVEASRAKSTMSPGVGSAYARMMGMMRDQDERRRDAHQDGLGLG